MSLCSFSLWVKTRRIISPEQQQNMSSKAKTKKTTKKRAQRATSNVFAMFDQSQIQEFKEAFNMIDQNRDGFIDAADLKDMFASLGKDVTDDYVEDMLNDANGAINFTMFLTLFGEKLNGTDPEDVIRNAFACFDEEQAGNLDEDRLVTLLQTLGDRWALFRFFRVFPLVWTQHEFKSTIYVPLCAFTLALKLFGVLSPHVCNVMCEWPQLILLYILRITRWLLDNRSTSRIG